jgi:predicted enzyme related to lactoylglutathione lyase
MTLPEQAAGAPPHWLGYVGSPDVDGTARRAAELGGQVLVPPTDIPNIGRFTVLRDPQGAVIAGYTSASAQQPPPSAGPRPGEMSWHELATTDYQAALAFYTNLFGWEKQKAEDMGPLGIYQMYGRNGQPLGGMFTKPAEMPAPPHWLYYTLVSDLDGVVEKVKKAGGRILNGPMDVPGGDRIAQCMDPQGAAFALHERKKA